MTESKSDLGRILDNEMKSLIGTRSWNVWKNDIEPEMYNTIIQAMYKYGEKKWNQAQFEILNQKPNKTEFKP